MSNSETSSYDSFNSSVTDTLLTSIRSTDDSSVSKIKITDDELKLIHNFNEKDDYKGQNIRDLTWKVFDNYFNNPLRLTQHHLDSYNHFISFIIPKIIRDYNPIIVKTNYSKTNNKYMDEYHINFGDVYIGKPGIKEKDGKTKMMYPIEARWRNLTYSADLYVDIYQKFIKHSEIKGTPPTIKEYPPTKKVSLRTIPIMVKSKYCPLSSETGRSKAELGECEYDKCGYFIVKGAEKALICQERKCENKILAFSHNKTQTAYSNTVEISSVPSIRSFVRSTQLKLYKKTGNGTIQVFIQRFKNENPFPLFIVFRALGITSDRDIMERILFNPNSPRNKKAFDLLIPSINEASSIQSQEMALLYMANYVSRLPEMKEGDVNEEKFRQNYVTQLLKTELFPHVGEDFMKKAWFLGMMAKKLIDTALGIRKYDDRDSFINKRVSSSGVLMEDLFRNNFNKLIKDIIKEVENYMNNGRIDEVHTSILKKIRASTIESSIRYSLGTGTWGMKSQASSSKKGIAQPLNRLSYSSAISHLRRVNAPRAEKGGKITEPRKLHGTQWGRFCVTGDTIITMSNGDMKNISELKDGDVVMTINPKTLQKEPSRIYEWFYRDCDKLLELTTISGRTIKCTPEHPFLISKDGLMEWKTAGELKENDNFVISHSYDKSPPSLEKYTDFIKKYSIGNGLMLAPIVDIKEIEPEKVYDFTTISHNHSFIANGFVTHNCPSETPDGHMVGIVKNMAMMAYITVGSDPETIISVLNEENVKNILDANPYEMDEQVRIFINGDPFGCTSEPERITAKLRALRRKGSLDPYISISWVVQEQEIRIHTEGGRISRPLFVVKNNRLTITPDDFKEFSNLNKEWQDLILEGKIEYLDVQEEDTSMIATYYEDLLANKQDNPTYVHYTHCEIHPSMIFGAAAATIPFVENNQGIRIMYESAQKKQALSVYATNYRNRMDNPGQVLRFPQVPIVSTKLAKYLHERDLPSGENAIVAIACFTGYNQEDSLIMNKGAIDRGLFTSMYYRTYKDSERKNQASLELEKFCKPVKYNPNGTLRTAGTNAASYDLLDENGFVKVGSYVKEGDVIIGKVVPLKNTTENGPKFKDASTTIGPNSSGVVDWVYVNKDSDGYQFVKVRIRSIKIPGIGDKFSSRFGQKGTIGMIYDQEDMPFTAEGITPDIIVNPAAIPSRMTIGQLLESVIGKAACIDGFECDATPFSSENVDTPDKLANILQSAGFRKYGTEEMFNGRNGKKFNAKLFMGPTYYQRLKHMSKDKLHARATGPLQLLTRQPPEGRKRDGGFRFGEMERDCMLGHAAMGFLKEKMFDCSDKYAFYVCDECGRIANCNPSRNIFECLACKDSTSFSQVQCPYSSKLFFQELMSMGILPRLFTENEE